MSNSVTYETPASTLLLPNNPFMQGLTAGSCNIAEPSILRYALQFRTHISCSLAYLSFTQVYSYKYVYKIGNEYYLRVDCFLNISNFPPSCTSLSKSVEMREARATATPLRA